MATMVKEKHRNKKKSKEKHSSKSILPENELSSTSLTPSEDNITIYESRTQVLSSAEPEHVISSDSTIQNSQPQEQNINISVEQCSNVKEHIKENQTEAKTVPTEPASSINHDTSTSQHNLFEIGSYKNLNMKLERMAIPNQPSAIDDIRMLEIENYDAYLKSNMNKTQLSENTECSMLESVAPSAPMFEEETSLHETIQEQTIQFLKPKPKCMPLSESIRLYGGTEMTAVSHMSEREEAEVEAGPNCGPEHPLVDLLSTYRSSLGAVERERSKLASNFHDEEKSRTTLWKIEKRNIYLTEKCKCGLKVDMRATYEHAQLLKERLPAAKLKLEGLLRDVQESYCHHQHAALLAYCQIKDLVSETIKSNKSEIRIALSLILHALRVSDGAPDVYPATLQIWAEVLARALVDERDLRQLLFVMHQLFRQTRSVRWAARVLHTRVTDSVTAARMIALLDTLLSKLNLESAVECVEETEDAWEEMDVRGGGGAVSSGTLRERDLIALVQALPLQQLIAKLVLFTHADFRKATEYEWGDASGGNGLLKSCCGVRVLLSVLQRAVTAHPVYGRLHAVLRVVACSALTSLACLYRTPRAPYFKELEEKITAELEAAFVAGFTLFGTHELHKLPATLLTEDSAKDYCITFITGLHDKTPKAIESLSIEAPVLPCDLRLRIITQAAITREQDHELARIVLEFLLETGLKRKSVTCKSGCEPVARECVSQLLTTHPYLRGLALHTVADFSQVESLDPSTISMLQVEKWRPDVEELNAVLVDWSQRCPTLLQQLLLKLDYTPHIGLPLELQVHIGRWLCGWSTTGAGALEAAWRVLVRLRTHRVCWPRSGDAPPPDPEPTDLFSRAFAVLASDWGHSIPLICSVGVNAIHSLCQTRPREAVHCLAPVMLMMTLTPESVSFTPKFAELFTLLVNCGPNLVQRALGRGGVSGSELLLRLVLSQVEVKNRDRGSYHVFPTWLHALWKVPSALSILDVGAVASRDWYAIDVHADYILQHAVTNSEFVANAVRFASSSPLLSESVLKKVHMRDVKSNMFPTLLSDLHEQRLASQKIHVDNALTRRRAGKTSEDLSIYQCANVVLVAPFHHPSHITLWSLFFHLYLERPPNTVSAPPCGPLFFSGIIKSRVLVQLKKRLLETSAYHQNEAQTYKNKTKNETNPSNQPIRSQSITIDTTLLPALTKKDLTDDERDYSESDSDSEGAKCANVAVDGSTEEAIEVDKKRFFNMADYHSGAKKLVDQFSRWLDEGERVREGPMHAAFDRFIPAQALEEAWNTMVARSRPSPSLELDNFIRPEPAPSYNVDAPKTALKVAVASILSVKCRSSKRRNPTRVDKMEAGYGDIRLMLSKVAELLKDIEKYAQEWRTEVLRISSLDSRLWELVSALRVPRPLPPVTKQCANKCKPIKFHLNTHEWCISSGAERGIRESRSASLAGIQRLSRARPQVARTVAALHTIARRIRSADDAVKVLELAWTCAGRCQPCSSAHSALTTLFDELAERWITSDGDICRKMLQKGCARNCTALQQALCGSMVSPRRMPPNSWPAVYITLLYSDLPSHTTFSYLSRFEMNRWTEIAEESQRIAVLDALHVAVQRCGTDPAHSVLTEIIGVHTALLLRPRDLHNYLFLYARVSTDGVLPPAFWRHLNKAAEALAGELIFDELGNILRDLGKVWFAVNYEYCERHATYATYMADLLCILLRAFVAAAVKLTYEPTRVAWYAWSAMVESWAPWVFPATILPQPTAAAGTSHYITMLNRFTACVRQVMRDCPGSEPKLLLDIFAWVITTFRGVLAMEPARRPRLQLSVLLVEIGELPWWEYQWFNAPSVLIAIDVIQRDDEELIMWCVERVRATIAVTFLNDLEKTNGDLPGFLVHLLKFFTGNLYVNNPELLKQGALVPWWDLTEDGLTEGLNEFFRAHFDLAQPYHEKPQANVILHAGELEPHPQYSHAYRRKRQLVVSRWTNAYTVTALRSHRAGFTQYMLNHFTRLEPYMEKTEEAKDLLYRLAHIMLWEQTDTPTAVSVVWQQWICSLAPPCLLPACAAMACQVTVLKVTAPIADAAVRMHLQKCEGGWSELRQLFSAAVFEARLYADSGALHAAYATALARCTRPAHVRPALANLQTLTETNYDFVKNDAIIAVWICFAARVAWECDDTIAPGATACDIQTPHNDEGEITASEIEECKHTAVSVLTAWGQQQRRSILKVVTLQADNDRPTARHRLLVRLVECILSPSPSAVLAYESACANLPQSSGDVIAWGRTPSLRKLVRLSVRLYPTHERYFQWELDRTSME